MPKFLSDEEMAQKEGSAAPKTKRFISDDEMNQRETAETQRIEKNRPSELESGFRGSMQGLSAGFADEGSGLLAGVVRGVGDTVSNAAQALNSNKPFGEAYDEAAKDDKGFWQNYRDVRDYTRRKEDRAQAANPKVFKGTEIGGGIASTLVPGLGFMNAAKGAKAATVLGKAAGTGALTGLGMSEADVTKGHVAEAAADAALGGVVSAATGGLVHGTTKALNPKVLKHLAEQRAFKAAAGGVDRAQKAARNRVNEIGRHLLDNKIVTFGSRAKTIAERAGAAKERAGAEIGDLLKAHDEVAMGGASKAYDKLNFPWAKKGTVSGTKMAEKMRAYADSIDTPNTRAVADKIRAQADEYASMGNMSLTEANRIKGGYQWDVRDPAVMSLGKKATNQLKGIVGREMDEGVALAAKRGAQPAEMSTAALKTGTGTTISAPNSTVLKEARKVDAAAPDYAKLKSQYGAFATAEEAAKTRAQREAKNRTFGLSDVILGGAAGAATLNPVKGMAVAAGSKVLRERGSAMAAVTLDKAAKLLEKTPESLGRWAPVLAAAAQRGNLGAVHYVLMKNQPEYRELVLKQERDQ